MLAVHWTPVSNTADILKNGIRKGKRGVFCFPVTGFRSLDAWWVRFFNHGARTNRKKYNGIVFRLTEDDFPAQFGHWAICNDSSAAETTVNDLKSLGEKYRHTVLWRMGEAIAARQGFVNKENRMQNCIDIAVAALAENPQALIDSFNSAGFMEYVFEDYQIILPHAIAAKRIIRIIASAKEKARFLRRQVLCKDL